MTTGGRVRRRSGALEIWGGLVTGALRHATFLSGGAAAITLGHVVLGQNEACLDRCRAHELVHVAQAERWGPFFLPAYAVASLLAWSRGGHGYLDNAFEVEARRHEASLADADAPLPNHHQS